MLHHDQDKTIKHAKAEQTAAGGHGCRHPPALAQCIRHGPGSPQHPMARGHGLSGTAGLVEAVVMTQGTATSPQPRATFLGTHSPTGLFLLRPASQTELFTFPHSVSPSMVSSWKPSPSLPGAHWWSPCSRDMHPPCKLLWDPAVPQRGTPTNHYTASG